MAGHESSDDKQSGNNALQYITLHYIALPPFVTRQTVFTMSTLMIQRHQIYCQRGLPEETIETILGSLWRILTYNAKETSAKASKKDKSQARQCQLWQNLSTNSDPQSWQKVLAVCRLHQQVLRQQSPGCGRGSHETQGPDVCRGRDQCPVSRSASQLHAALQSQVISTHGHAAGAYL